MQTVMAEARSKPHIPSQKAKLRRKRTSYSRFVLAFLLTAFILVFAYTGYMVVSWARASLSPTASGLIDNLPQVVAPPPADAAEKPGPANSPSDAAPTSPPPDMERKDRINILIMGIDQRPDEGVATRTDTMIVLTADPATGDVGMISLPRDLYVEIPGLGMGKINTAHVLGETRQYPGGGPALAKVTVEQFLGYHIHYYVRLNFDGFSKLIDEIGGIYIDVPREIYDEKFPGENYDYDPLYIPAGQQHMMGEMALKYARVRNVDDDYGRARRQQQVLVAIKDQLFSRNMILPLLVKAPTLLRTLSQSVSTDISLTAVMDMVNIVRSLDLENIKQLVIDRTMGQEGEDEKAGWILRADPALYRPAVDAVFGIISPTPQPMVIGTGPKDTSGERLAEEDARIAILNGTETPGLAAQTSAWLQEQGFQVAGYNNASQSNYTHSVLLDYTGKKAFTLNRLVQLFSIQPSNVNPAANGPDGIDIVIIIGADFKASNISQAREALLHLSSPASTNVIHPL